MKKNKEFLLLILLVLLLNNAIGAITYSNGGSISICSYQQASIVFTITEGDKADFVAGTYYYSIGLNNVTDFDIIQDINISYANPSNLSSPPVEYDNSNPPTITVISNGVNELDVITIKVNVRRKTTGVLSNSNSKIELKDGGGNVKSSYTLSGSNPIFSNISIENYCLNEKPSLDFTYAPACDITIDNFRIIKKNGSNFTEVLLSNISETYTSSDILATISILDASTVYYTQGLELYYFNYYTYENPDNHKSYYPTLNVEGTTFPYLSDDPINLTSPYATKKTVSSFNKDDSNIGTDQNRTMVFDGYIDIPKAGTYSFYLKSDNWSRFYIGSVPKKNPTTNDALSATYNDFATLKQIDHIFNTAGKYPIRLEYGDHGDQETLILQISSNDMVQQDIPAHMLYRKVNVPTTGTPEYRLMAVHNNSYTKESDPITIPAPKTPQIQFSSIPSVCIGETADIKFSINNSTCKTSTKKVFCSVNGGANAEVTNLTGGVYTSTQTVNEGDSYLFTVSYDYNNNGTYLESGGLDGNFTNTITAATLTERNISLQLETVNSKVCYGTDLDIEIIPSGCVPESLKIKYTDGTNYIATPVWSSLVNNTANTGKVYNDIFVPGKTVEIEAIYSSGSSIKQTILISTDRFMIPVITKINTLNTPVCPNENIEFTTSMSQECLTTITTRKIFIEENSTLGNELIASGSNYNYPFNYNKNYKVVIKYFIEGIQVPQFAEYSIANIQGLFNDFAMDIEYPDPKITCYGENLDFILTPKNSCSPNKMKVVFTTGNTSKNFSEDWNYGPNPHTISVPAVFGDVFSIIAEFPLANDVTVATVTISETTFPDFYDTVGIKMQGYQPDVSFCPNDPVEVIVAQNLARKCDLDRIELVGKMKNNIEVSLGNYDEITGDTITLAFNLTSKDFISIYSKGYKKISSGNYLLVCTSDTITIGESLTGKYDVSIVPTLSVDIDLENNTIYSSIYGSQMNLTDELSIDNFYKLVDFYYTNNYLEEAPSLYYSITSLNPELFSVIDSKILTSYNFQGRKFALLPKKSGKGKIEIKRLTPNTNCYDTRIIDVDITPDIIDADPIYCAGYDIIDTVKVATDWLSDDDIKPTHTIFKELQISTDGESYYQPERIDDNNDKFALYLIRPTDYFNNYPTDNPDSLESISIRFRLIVNVNTAILELYNGSDSARNLGNIRKLKLIRKIKLNPITNIIDTTYEADFLYRSSIYSNVWSSDNKSSFKTIEEAKTAYEKYLDEENYEDENAPENYYQGYSYYYKYRSEEQIPGFNNNDSIEFLYNRIQNRYVVSHVVTIKKALDRANSEVYKPVTNDSLQNYTGPYCYGQDPIRIYGTLLTDSITGSDAITFNKGTRNWYYDPKNKMFDTITTPFIDSIVYHFQDKNTCASFKKYQIIVNPSPIDTILADVLCLGDSTSFTAIKDPSDLTVNNVWNWNFGDDFILSKFDTNTIKHKYRDSGKRDVILTTSNIYGCNSIDTMSIVIETYPEIDFKLDNHLQNHTTNLINNSSSNSNSDIIISNNWIIDYMGENVDTIFQDTIQSSVFEFANHGVYDVSLQITTKNGCKSDSTISYPIFEVIEISNDEIYPNSNTTNIDNWLNSVDFNPSNEIKTWEYIQLTGNSPLIDDYHKEGSWVWYAEPLENQHAWIESSCFDISELDVPMIQFDIYQSIETGLDGAVIQYTLNDGKSWLLLGNIGEGINWYNKEAVVSAPGSKYDGTNEKNEAWSGYKNVWETVAFPIDKIKSSFDTVECVRFRIVYSSNGSSAPDKNFNGFGFTNFIVSKRNKVVLLEQFVNSKIEGSDYEEKYVDSVFTTNEYSVIRYHIEKDFNKDAVYDLNPVDVSARAQEYGTPAKNISATVDGIKNYTMLLRSQKDSINSFVLRRNLLIPKFSIHYVEMVNYNGSLMIYATVRKETLNNSEIYNDYQTFVRIAIVDPEYAVGNVSYKDVLVELLPNGPGNYVYAFNSSDSVGTEAKIAIYWTPGENVDIANDLKLVVYVQDMVGANEVHQVYQEVIPANLSVSLSKPLNISNNNYIVFPNPTEDYVSIGSEEPGSATWKLYSASGYLVKQGEIDNESYTRIDVRNLSDGTYFFDIINEEKDVQKLWFVKH